MLMEIGFDRSMLVLRMMGSATTMMMKQIYQKVQINEKSLMKVNYLMICSGKSKLIDIFITVKEKSRPSASDLFAQSSKLRRLHINVLDLFLSQH